MFVILVIPFTLNIASTLWYHDDSTKDNDLHPIMLRPLPNAILSHCDLQRSCLY